MSHESDILRANFTIQPNCPMEKFFSPNESKERNLDPLANEKSSQLSQKPELFAGANACAINIQLLVVPCLTLFRLGFFGQSLTGGEGGLLRPPSVSL